MNIPRHIPERLENLLDRVELDILASMGRWLRDVLCDTLVLLYRRPAANLLSSGPRSAQFPTQFAVVWAARD